MDTAFIAKCADPNLKPAIVQEFVTAVGSDDPLAITVKADGRLVLIPRPRSPEEALQVAKEYLGQAVVRVGITQYPAGVGIADASQLQPTVFDACENLRTGTAIFAKVGRIVTKWYGRPTSTELLPQMLDDAIYAWKTGSFEGANVFRAEDPGGPTFFGAKIAMPAEPDQQGADAPTDQRPEAVAPASTDAGIRINLSRIGGGR